MSTRQPVVVLHVGAMKTGTTYLQNKVLANRDALAEQGVDFAGERWRQQVSAVQDLLSLAQHDPNVEQLSSGAWDRLVHQIRGTDARASLLSMEFLSFAGEEAARRAVSSLQGLEVHVVITVRDTAAIIPSLWQTSITSGGVTTWPRYTKVVRASMRAGGRVGSGLARAGVPSARRFGEAIDIPRMIRVWTSVLPADRVHVLVVPGSSAPRDRLWELFSEILEVDPAALTAPPEHVNESLGLPSAELVRRLNAALRLRQPSQQRTVKVDLARDGLGPLRAEERRAQLDPATFRAALRWNKHIRSVLASSGVRVHGDVADLPTEADPADYQVDAVQEPAAERELIRAARQGFRTLRRLNRRLVREALPRQGRARYLSHLAAQLAFPRGWQAADDPVALAVEDLATLTRSAIRLERLAARRRRRARRRKARRRAARQAARRAERRAERRGVSGAEAADASEG
ncbi:hypothetical protein HNR19_004113 [Nocardioides thalensis]|uniref:Sulfotransferase family protein n=1 Tax=Nocardioides thalensis TaxID=1914755 RepID=A0A853C6D6_9ACTN|nr:hypothetical protein [Nocardioides thalensis]NYJ03415.1 hypothetical protein [Nocardioides thalensis]